MRTQKQQLHLFCFRLAWPLLLLPLWEFPFPVYSSLGNFGCIFPGSLRGTKAISSRPSDESSSIEYPMNRPLPWPYGHGRSVKPARPYHRYPPQPMWASRGQRSTCFTDLPHACCLPMVSEPASGLGQL